MTNDEKRARDCALKLRSKRHTLNMDGDWYDIFRLNDKNSIKLILALIDEIRAEAADRVEQAIERCPRDKYEGRMIMPGYLRAAITGKE